MRQNCRNRVLGLIQQIRKLQVNQKCAEVMLILDDITTPLLSSVVVEFMALGVKNVTKAHLKKKPFPNYIGIYYISKQSLPHLFQDFEKQSIYHSINLLLSEPISQEVMQSVADNKKITQRLSYFGELLLNTKYLTSNLGIICKEENIFTASMKNEYKVSPSVMADHILESVISGFHDPSRLIMYHSNSHYIQDITKELASKYQSYKSQLDISKKQGKSLRLIVVDRMIDAVSPLVRNFYYLNLISDIFNVDFQHREVILRNGSKVTVNFDDSIFMDYKNLHFSKVQGKIEPDLQKFKSENKAAQLRQEGVSMQNKLSNMELKQVIKNIPQYNRKVKSYQEHVNISLDITQVSKEQKLPEIGEIQQLIVSGIDGRGEEIKDKRIVERAHQLCIRLTDHQKIVKITLLMLLCLEVSQSQTKMFINKIKQYPQYSSLAEFLQRHLQKILPKPMKLRLSPQRQRLFLHMHESLVENILGELIEKGASKHVYLSVVGDQPKKRVQSKFQAMNKRQQKEWLIVMLGGISLNEIVQLQRIQKKFEGNKISILSTEVLTTWSYMDKLATLYDQ